MHTIEVLELIRCHFLHGYTKDKNAKIKQTSFITLCNQGKVSNRLVINQLLWLRNQLFYFFMHKIKYFLRILIIHGQGQELEKKEELECVCTASCF